MRWSLTAPRGTSRGLRGATAGLWGRPSSRMTHHAAPTPMSTSPNEKTLAMGTGLGRANTSPRNGSEVPGPMSVELVNALAGTAAAPLNSSHASGAEGI